MTLEATCGTAAVRPHADTSIVDDPERLIALEAVHNFRDLGGYAMGDGRRIAWGRLFRADGLQRLTDRDLEVMDAIGIRTVVDLRSAAELAERGRYPLERHRVDFHHLSVLDTTWMHSDVPTFADTDDGAVEFLVWAYRQMLVDGAERFGRAIQLLAEPGVAPAVFHCAAGKDRTGVLAALILGGLGVDDELIVADYGLTEAAMERMRRWILEHRADMASAMADAPNYMMAAKPEAMRQVLVDVRTEHGSIAGYLDTIGVDADVLAALADALAAR